MVIILHHLTHSPCILHINLKPATPSDVSPSTHHMHPEHQPYRQSHKQLHSTILQQALLCMPIEQYRSRDPLLIPCRVYFISLLYLLLNISLSLNHGTIEPHSLRTPLYMGFVYLLILQSWCNITFTLPYNRVYTLLTLIYYKYLSMILQYTSFKHLSV